MINYKGVSPCDSNNKWAFLCCPCLCLWLCRWGTPDPRAPFKNNIKANKGQWKYELQTASDLGMQDARCKRPESVGKIGKCGKTEKSDENLGDSWVVVVVLLFLLLLSLLGRRSPSLAWSMDPTCFQPQPQPRLGLRLRLHLRTVWLTGDSTFDVWQSTLSRKPQGMESRCNVFLEMAAWKLYWINNLSYKVFFHLVYSNINDYILGKSFNYLSQLSPRDANQFLAWVTLPFQQICRRHFCFLLSILFLPFFFCQRLPNSDGEMSSGEMGDGEMAACKLQIARGPTHKSSCRKIST